MRRLCWKEWRERRWWLLLWTLAVVGTAAFGKGQPFLGSMTPFSSWAMLPIAFALLVGLGAYGSELSGERIAFLYSRPLSWKQVLAAKIVVGLSMALLAPLLGAVVLRFVVPVEFLPFVTPVNLALGAMQFAGIMGAAFLIGLGCSVALPGIAGSILILLCWFGIFLAIGYVIDEYVDHFDIVEALLQIALPFPLIAAVILVRFGVTLKQGTRMKRYLVMMLTAVVLGTLLIFIPTIRNLLDWDTRSSDRRVRASVCRSGKFASVTESEVIQGKQIQYMGSWINLTSGKVYPVTTYGFRSYRDDEVHLAEPICVVDLTADPESIVVFWLGDGQVYSSHVESISERRWLNYQVFISPDDRRILISGDAILEVFTLHTGKRQVIAQVENDVKGKDFRGNHHNLRFSCSWWQSDDEVGYLDPASGKRVLVRVR